MEKETQKVTELKPENESPAETLEEKNGSSPEKEERLFTQDEVNEIVKKRLSREKNGQLEEIQEKLEDIEKRENFLKIKTYVMEQGLPVELLSVIDTSDFELFKEKADVINSIYSKRNTRVSPSKSESPLPFDDRSFGNTKHIPKGYTDFD